VSHDLNQCNFIGRLGKDPDALKYTPSGSAVLNISIAVGWKSKDKEGVEWVRVVFFGKLAETAAQYLRKGSQVYISGRMQTRSWDNKEGVKQYMTEIHAERMQMLGGKGAAEGREVDQPGEVDGAGKDDGFDEDIPF
jgi:single-strand DNA-binding protein